MCLREIKPRLHDGASVWTYRVDMCDCVFANIPRKQLCESHPRSLPYPNPPQVGMLILHARAFTLTGTENRYSLSLLLLPSPTTPLFCRSISTSIDSVEHTEKSFSQRVIPQQKATGDSRHKGVSRTLGGTRSVSISQSSGQAVPCNA